MIGVECKLETLTLQGSGILSKVMCILGFADVPMGIHTMVPCPL